MAQQAYAIAERCLCFGREVDPQKDSAAMWRSDESSEAMPPLLDARSRPRPSPSASEPRSPSRSLLLKAATSTSGGSGKGRQLKRRGTAHTLRAQMLRRHNTNPQLEPNSDLYHHHHHHHHPHHPLGRPQHRQSSDTGAGATPPDATLSALAEVSMSQVVPGAEAACAASAASAGGPRRVAASGVTFTDAGAAAVAIADAPSDAELTPRLESLPDVPRAAHSEPPPPGSGPPPQPLPPQPPPPEPPPPKPPPPKPPPPIDALGGAVDHETPSARDVWHRAGRKTDAVRWLSHPNAGGRRIASLARFFSARMFGGHFGPPSERSDGRASTSGLETARSEKERSRVTRRQSVKRNSVAPFEGAFVNAEDLAEQVTATDLDPVQAALVRKAFRLLDSMSALLGVLGPKEMMYFAHHMGKLPSSLQHTDANEDGLWSIEEFSRLCLELIKIHGDDKFRVLVEGLLESYAHKCQLHEVYWHGWALWMDYVCGFSLTTLYTIALAVLLSYIGRLPSPPDVTTVISTTGL
jgi:hypothetical protein